VTLDVIGAGNSRFDRTALLGYSNARLNPLSASSHCSTPLYPHVARRGDCLDATDEWVGIAAEWILSHTPSYNPAVRPILMSWSAALAFESTLLVGAEGEALRSIQQLGAAFIAIGTRDRGNPTRSLAPERHTQCVRSAGQLGPERGR
jgi:hypothetical protein